MILDKISKQRFDKLEEDSSQIEASKKLQDNYKWVSEELLLGWKVKVKNLLSNVCGEESQYFKDFENEEKLPRWSNYDEFTALKAVFLSAKDDFENGCLPSIKILSDVDLVEQICKRIAKSAGILSTRKRKNKKPYLIEDEYDVQDLLQAILRAYLKYSVQEDPLSKVAGTSSSRADISIEELGILIELKYVRSPDDGKKILEDFSNDLVLYSAWKPLETLFFVIYNSSYLQDPDALEKLSGIHVIKDKRFNNLVILA